MSRQLLQFLAVAVAIGLSLAAAQDAAGWHRSDGSHGSYGSFGGIFRGSHGGSFGGFFSRRHGSHGSYGSYGGNAGACDCNGMDHGGEVDDVDVDDQGVDPDRDDGVMREESGERTTLRPMGPPEERSRIEDEDRDANVESTDQDSNNDTDEDAKDDEGISTG